MPFLCNLDDKSKVLFREYIKSFIKLNKNNMATFILLLGFISEYCCGYLFIGQSGVRSDGAIMYEMDCRYSGSKPLLSLLRKLRNNVMHAPYKYKELIASESSSLYSYNTSENILELFSMFESDSMEIMEAYISIMKFFDCIAENEAILISKIIQEHKQNLLGELPDIDLGGFNNG